MKQYKRPVIVEDIDLPSPQGVLVLSALAVINGAVAINVIAITNLFGATVAYSNTYVDVGS